MKSLRRIIWRRWIEWLFLCLFLTVTIISGVGHLFWPWLDDGRYAPALNAALSIGTGGLVAFTFYYAVNERIEQRRQNTVRDGALRAYRDAKRNIALALIHSSQKGGRTDLSADSETVDKILTIDGFKALFEGGREADEGFYAFQNQMSNQTPEYDEIIFNFKIIGRACDRLLDSTHLDDKDSYDRLVRLDAFIRRIENNGAGYNESELLCRFVWEVFAGWSFIKGSLGYDPIERALENS